ncbi:MAG: hypothetical protein ACEQSR_04665 [Candidatus Methylacidiphilales bacterium]
MEDWQVKDLPVVQNGKLMGTVNEKLLFDNEDEKVANILNPNAGFCFENTHFYDLLKLLFIGNISTISVLDKEQNFIGIIATKDLAKQLFDHSTLSQDGGIIVLQMNARNYSLAEIARITEVNNAKILYLHVNPLADAENNIQVSLKYNITDLKYIIATFERFNYQVVFSSQQMDEDDSSSKRYDWLIKYLNT